MAQPPATLPADFNKWDSSSGPPTTLPADFNKWDAAPQAPKEMSAYEQVGNRIKQNVYLIPDMLDALKRQIRGEAPTQRDQELMQQAQHIKEMTGGDQDSLPSRVLQSTSIAPHIMYDTLSGWLNKPATAVGDILSGYVAHQISAAPQPIRQTAAAEQVSSKVAPQPSAEIAPENPTAQEAPAPSAVREPLPPSERPLNAESALKQVLTGQDNANLMKIAKSRGLNVTKESQLKAGVADKLLVEKIADDFAANPDDLQEFNARYLEANRMGKHNFGDIGAEAWKTMSLQQYFPDVKIPAAVMKRMQSAIAANRPATVPTDIQDLTPQLQKSLEMARKARAARTP